MSDESIPVPYDKAVHKTTEGILIDITVIAHASINKVEGIRNGRLLVRTTAIPERAKQTQR